ncbi:MAG: thioredoxin domain-containing protein [Myxococcales bacterium]|nr:thioredoxin domain-containing protein [Myxococcales bacterium]
MDSFEPGSVFRDFRIERRLADDAGNALYAVKRLGEQAALRVYASFGALDGSESGKLTEAALAGAAVGSVHVPSVKLCGIDSATGLAWVALGSLEGQSLAGLLARGTSFDSASALSIVRQVAEALGSAHATGQAHGELTPASVFIGEVPGADGAPAVKLLDLGSLRWLNEHRQGGHLGSPEWRAPEEHQQGAAPSPHADVWALGLLAFRLLTGHSYWNAPDGGAVVNEITAEPLPSATKRVRDLNLTATLPEGFDEWFAGAVTRDLGRRFANAGDAARALRGLTNSSDAPGRPVGAPPWGSGSPTPWAAGAVAGTNPAAASPARYGPAEPSAPRAPYGYGAPGAGPFRELPDAAAQQASDRSGAGLAIGLIVGALVLVGVLAFGALTGFVMYTRARKPLATPKATATATAFAVAVPAGHDSAPIPVLASDPIWGNNTAPVTIVEFSDLECPFCARAHTTLEQVKTSYGPTQLRLVMKHNPLPFHKQARPAAEAAERVLRAGGSGAFWQFVDRAYADRTGLNDANFATWAAAAGANMTTYESLVASPSVAAKIESDMALAKRIGARGTPTFFINGKALKGAQPLTKFQSVIDEQLAEAKKRIAAGAAPEQIYPTLTRENFNSPESPPPAEAKPDPDQLWYVPVNDDEPQLGPRDALVTLVEFGDFQCPFCKRLEPTLKQLRQEYGNDLRLVWKDNPLPFHKRAEPAARLARVIYDKRGNKAFWTAHDLLFDSQPRLEDDDLSRIASAAGTSFGAVQAAMTAPAVARRIQASQALAADVKATGTPSCFINGRVLTGAQPLSKFKELVDQELAAARRLVEAGTPRADVYKTIIGKGERGSPFEFKEVTLPTRSVPIRGRASARVTLHVFSDFQCPFCARVEPTLDEVLKRYPDQVRIAWHDLPLAMHNNAARAAEAAREVQAQRGDAAFWLFHDRLFKEQRDPGALGPEHLESVAVSLGCNRSSFAQALDTGRHTARVKEDSDAAVRAGISGTPSFLLASHGKSSGRFYYLSGAQPLSKFERVIDAALAE